MRAAAESSDDTVSWASDESHGDDCLVPCAACTELFPYCSGGLNGQCRFEGRDSLLTLTGHRVLAGYCCPVQEPQREGTQCIQCGAEVGPPRPRNV